MEKNQETLFLDKNDTPKNIVSDFGGCLTRVAFEGADPETLEMCLPLENDIDDEDCGYYRTKSRHFNYDD